MSYWPKLRLTKEEAAYLSKYHDPDKGRRGVIRRMYPGSLTLSATQRQPQFPFQIGRRCKVFGITFAGDIDRFKLEIITATGEKHTNEPTRVAHMCLGPNQSPQGLYGIDAQPPVMPAAEPYIIDPAITLEANVTLSFNGYQTEPYSDTSYRLDFTVHVWEYPGMPGSPL